MNLPNFLTSLRFVLIPVYIFVFMNGHMIPAFLIMVAAGVTDVLDGYIARRSGQVTAVGMMLDPLADKLMMITVIVSLLVSGHISWAAAAAMFLRDLGMIAGSFYYHFRGKKTVPSNWAGKLTTVLLYSAIMLIFFETPYAHSYLWLVIGFSFVTSIMYIVMFKAINKTITETPAPPGHH
ncbi:CDP-alcohol phosphatidyltransferase family protein [Paenibacillus harenae]|uniref:CDP-alcohol phosphatidyltransferase family protein n=1 Tax=Paenibacillus harenae TaxID=306543 RepID=UPI00041A2ACA|nr:CDP-alcohol phosphatidyltransferase family protein [Paenibacillus harenae]